VALFVLVPGILPGAVALGCRPQGRLMAETIENRDRRPLTIRETVIVGVVDAAGLGMLLPARPAAGMLEWRVEGLPAAS